MMPAATLRGREGGRYTISLPIIHVVVCVCVCVCVWLRVYIPSSVCMGIVMR